LENHIKKIKNLFKKLCHNSGRGKDELFIVDDKLGTPTYTHDFANNVKLLLEEEYWGLYNMVCDGITGRYEVATELIDILGLNDSVKITPVTSDYWKEEYFADRPPSERLIDRKLNLRGVNIMRDWRICLKEYINDYYQNYL
jgi:dTDP-4-dehydrorhamnose reductase